MGKLFRSIIVAAFVMVVAAAVVWCLIPEKKGDVTVKDGEITGLEEMVRICTVDIYNEMPVKATVNNKMLFGIQKQTGSISFDIEHLEADNTGDTLRVWLPREIVEIHEATEPNSWEVIDTKGLTLFTSDRMTINEENRVKEKLKEVAVSRLYRNGTVKRARAEARGTLARMLANIYRKPVIVSDSTPNGQPRRL
jgi:hypothetical protein